MRAHIVSPSIPPERCGSWDGYIIVGTISDSEWRGFCAASERPDLAEDPRFDTPGGRAAHATERILMMAQIIRQRPTAEWLQRVDTNDVPSAPVLRRGEVIANEQVLARELIAEFDHPDIGRVRQAKPAARFDRTPSANSRAGAAHRRAQRSDSYGAGPRSGRDRAAGVRRPDRAVPTAAVQSGGVSSGIG